MSKYLYSWMTIFAALLLTSCEKTVEYSETTDDIILEDTMLEPGFAQVESRSVSTLYNGFGGIQEENILIEESTQTGSSRYEMAFGVSLLLGEKFDYDSETDEFSFEEDGYMQYYIVMCDKSLPLDTTLRLEVGKAYKADLIEMDVNSNEEFNLLLDSGDWIGGGIEVVDLIVEEITEEFFRGTFSGSYPLNATGEIVEISGEFNVVNVN